MASECGSLVAEILSFTILGGRDVQSIYHERACEQLSVYTVA